MLRELQVPVLLLDRKHDGLIAPPAPRPRRFDTGRNRARRPRCAGL